MDSVSGNMIAGLGLLRENTRRDQYEQYTLSDNLLTLPFANDPLYLSAAFMNRFNECFAYKETRMVPYQYLTTFQYEAPDGSIENIEHHDELSFKLTKSHLIVTKKNYYGAIQVASGSDVAQYALWKDVETLEKEKKGLF